MPRHAFPAFSVFPYYTKASADSDEKKRIQGILYAVKNGGQLRDGSGKERPAVNWFAEALTGGEITLPPEVFGAKRLLVPIPSSSVTLVPPNRQQWPMLDLATDIADKGVVGGAAPIILRTVAVPRAHMVSKDQKPSVERHIETMQIQLEELGGYIGRLGGDLGITLLDDVLSSGTSAMACYVALRRISFRGPITLLTAAHTVRSDYQGKLTASAKSLIVWMEGRWDRATRPASEIEVGT